MLGPEHPNVLMARNNLASATLKAGDPAAARDQYTALVPVMERVLGPEHPDTLMARSNLASATLEAGDAAAAGDQYTALVPVMERVLGPEHPDVLMARNNLGQATGRRGTPPPPATCLPSSCPSWSGCSAPGTRRHLTFVST